MFDFDPHWLTLAQDGAVPLPGQAPVQPADPTGATPAGPPRSSGFGPEFMFIMLGLLVVMIIVSTLGPRRERKKREAMIASIKKHDRVQTVGGVIGAIVEVKPDFVVLKVDESANTRITFARSAIQQILTPSGRSADGDAVKDEAAASSS
jgi:preprotein translocase subunit YajC